MILSSITDFITVNWLTLITIALIIKGLHMLANLRAILTNLAHLLDAALADSATLRAERDAALARVAELEADLAGVPDLEAVASGMVAKLQPVA